MSEFAAIDKLLAEVQQLRDTVQPTDRDAEFCVMEAERSKARMEASVARQERDAAVEELARVKADVGWTMDKLKIADFILMRGTEIPPAQEGYLALWSDPKDSERIEWINKHGRMSVNDSVWLIAIPHRIHLDSARLPEPYNIRHIIDLSRGVEVATTEEDA